MEAICRRLSVLSICLLAAVAAVVLAAPALADDASGDLGVPPGGAAKPAALRTPVAPAKPVAPERAVVTVLPRPKPLPTLAPPPPPLPPGVAALPDEPVVPDAPGAPDEPVAPDAPPVSLPPVDPPAAPVPEEDRAAYLEAVSPDTITPPPAPPRLVRSGYGCRRWDVTLEGALSIFDGPEGIMGEPVPPGVTPFRWAANDYSSEFGLRGTVRYSPDGRNRYEARGMWLGSWEESSRQTGQFGFRPNPGDPVVLSPAPVAVTLTNETDIWGAEFNWWRTVRRGPRYRLNAGAGARYLRIDDTASATNWAPLRVVNATGANLVGEAENGLLAAQLLGQYQRYVSARFQVSITAKALLGVMTNDLRESDTSIVTGGATADAVSDDTTFGWGFEGEVGALYYVSPRVGLTASYALLVVGEVVRANEMLDFSRAATGSIQLRSDGDTEVVHSFFFGVRLDL